MEFSSFLTGNDRSHTSAEVMNRWMHWAQMLNKYLFLLLHVSMMKQSGPEGCTPHLLTWIIQMGCRKVGWGCWESMKKKMELNRNWEPKKTFRWQIICSIASVTRKCISKRWETTTHLWEWQKSNTVTTPNVDKDVGQQELTLTVVGMYPEDSLAGSYTKHTLTVWPSNHLPWYLTK